jgi:hypothetical protein
MLVVMLGVVAFHGMHLERPRGAQQRQLGLYRR